MSKIQPPEAGNRFICHFFLFLKNSINGDRYFEGIAPDVWEFKIGGYQVLDKWLKDRKKAKRTLSFDDVLHYQKIVVALKETMQLMVEIDQLIPGFPIA